MNLKNLSKSKEKVQKRQDLEGFRCPKREACKSLRVESPNHISAIKLMDINKSELKIYKKEIYILK